MRPCEVCGRESSYDMWKAPLTTTDKGGTARVLRHLSGA